MKIACVDKTASSRLELQTFLERTLEDNREFLGYSRLAVFVPVSREELLHSSYIDAVIIGPRFTLDEALLLVRQLKESETGLSILVFVDEELFTVNNLQRFERFQVEVFSCDDCGPRFVNQLLGIVSQRVATELGKLIVVDGAKGGVGVTSIVSGLAHAAHAAGQSSIVVDLSPAAALLRYCSTERWQSSEYTSLLVDSSKIAPEMIDKLIVTAPNGIDFLLPPAGGTEVRELWLREHHSFEATLEIVTLLCERYDSVIVDLAGAEGILPFALLSRADVRLIVTSNEAASVHLLGLRLAEFADVPGRSEIVAAVNEFNEAGLSHEDIIGYLRSKAKRLDISWLSHSIPHDDRARFWMGTSNSFYTEARKQTRRALESALSRLLGKTSPAEELSYADDSGFKRLVGSFHQGRKLRLRIPRYLSLPPGSSVEEDHAVIPQVATATSTARDIETDFDFEQPRLIGNNSGSFTLESLLMFAGAAAVAIAVVPELLASMQIYLRGFSE